MAEGLQRLGEMGLQVNTFVESEKQMRQME
jgi:hypothetical protein